MRSTRSISTVWPLTPFRSSGGNERISVAPRLDHSQRLVEPLEVSRYPPQLDCFGRRFPSPFSPVSMPTRHRHQHSSERGKSFTITLESLFTLIWNRRSRCTGNRVHRRPEYATNWKSSFSQEYVHVCRDKMGKCPDAFQGLARNKSSLILHPKNRPIESPCSRKSHSAASRPARFRTRPLLQTCPNPDTAPSPEDARC